MRSSPLIEYSSTVLLICLWLGAITTVFSSLVGLFQQDIKKVIAYSTMSQLGLMVVAIGLSSYNVALFHLVNHAFYKAALFLGAGSIIHAVADNQDFRKYGGLREFLPLTYSVILIASLSLAAFPFLTGFYSKDLILESAFGQFTFSGVSVYVISTIGAIFTTLYSVKVLYLTFLANPHGSLNAIRHAHESDFFLTFPLIILAVFSIFFGYFTKDIFIGLGSNFFVDNSIFIHPVHEILVDTEFAVPTLFKLLPFIFTISFSILAIVLSEFLPGNVLNFKLSRLGRNIFGFFNQRFLVEMFYNNYITNLVLYFGGQTTKVLDKGSIELIGPFGLEKGLISLSKSLTKLSTGVVTSYALYILVGLISFIFILYLSEISPSLILLLILLAFFSLNENKQYFGGSSVISPSHPLKFSGLSLISGLRSSHPKTATSNKLGVRRYSTLNTNTNLKVVNSSFINFARFNGEPARNNGIMLKSQVKDRTGFIIDKGLQCKVGRFYTNGCFPDIELLALFRNSYIIDELNNYFQDLVKNKGLSLDKDEFCLLYNKQFPDLNSLLNEYPQLLDIQRDLNYDFENNNLDFNLFVFHDKKLVTRLEPILALIKKHNASVIIPKQSYFLFEKNVVLDWIAYNTPNFKDSTITPLVGTNMTNVDIKNKTPLSIYQQWLISLYMLTWEYKILNKVKLYLEYKGDLHTNILEILDKNTIYWLNRQLRLQSLDEVLNDKNRYIVDFYANKLAFKREIYEDFMYVLLNIILAYRIINSFEINEGINSDKFFTILTEIMKEHYIDYSNEYKYLHDLRWYRINHYFTTKQLFDIYNFEMKSREPK